MGGFTRVVVKHLSAILHFNEVKQSLLNASNDHGQWGSEQVVMCWGGMR